MSSSLNPRRGVIYSLMDRFYINPPDKPRIPFPRKKKVKKTYAVNKKTYPEFYKASRFPDIKKCPCGKMRARYSTMDCCWIIFCKEC